MKDQLQRVLTLDRWLRARRRIVAKEAAVELGVDERTIRRDLKQVLASQCGSPSDTTAANASGPTRAKPPMPRGPKPPSTRCLTAETPEHSASA